MTTEIKQLKKENLIVRIFEDEIAAGEAGAQFVAEQLNNAIRAKGFANLILATGASQFAFIHALKKQEIDWAKITVFHLDEYKDLPETHPASFRKYLKERILDEVKPCQVHYIHGDAGDIEGEIARYEELLRAAEIDVACIGIGENGHIAFNDPDVADFDDTRLVKVVQLDDACRRQQLGEGWFSTLEEVPGEAVSLTIPAIMRCKVISCMVPDKRKANAVHDTLNAEISTACPATILRRHPDTVLFLDENSASRLT
ncbi:glucosamine-6-phosphate deaminase [Proteiniphilum sp. X52]|uniref:glucosamine-6-phosphate deaminase n=1 Tax=Proteiniphilum sp. X52 TaxID=2382159 RepID=UPI000F09DE44|nr:glucosamine-6-phosphate deaminase [Proteiniphilum sp. X52]RNC64672.1 glucosamine-6-phosphate deaminase [Proteiniphilum sp. X52]